MDESVVMSNHLHWIVFIIGAESVGAHGMRPASTAILHSNLPESIIKKGARRAPLRKAGHQTMVSRF